MSARLLPQKASALGTPNFSCLCPPCPPVIDCRYIESCLGLTCPPRVNPADLLLDVVSGDLPPAWREARPTFDPQELFAKWEEHLAAEAAAAVVAGGGRGALSVVSGAPPASPAQPPPHDPTAFVRLVLLYFWRSLSQQLRHPAIALFNNVLVVIGAVGLALVYYGVRASQRAPRRRAVHAHVPFCAAAACCCHRRTLRSLCRSRSRCSLGAQRRWPRRVR